MLLADHGAVVRLRLQARVHRGQRVLRRLRPAVPERHVRSGQRATSRLAATFSKGTPMYELVFVAFQATFAAITCCLILGSFVERIKFSAVLLFMVIWFTFSYCRSRTWCGSGRVRTRTPTPDEVDALNATGGLHLADGRARLRRRHGRAHQRRRRGPGRRVSCSASASATARKPMPPHSLTMTMIGASLLWFGWFGFNAGSALEANGIGRARVPQHLSRHRVRGARRGRSPSGSSRASPRCSARRRARSPVWSRSRRPPATSASRARS